MKLWFMFDNHTFEKITGQDREAILEQAIDLFRVNGSGSLFVRDENDVTVNALTVHGRRMESGKYGVRASDLEKWADEIMAERSFRTLMA